MMIFLKIILFLFLGLVVLLAIGFAYMVYKFNHPTIPKVVPGGIRLACVGDSITQGSRSYPSILQELLGEDTQVLNYGHSGRTLIKTGDNPYWKSALFQPSLEANPAIVLIMLGTNDSKPQNWSAPDFEKQLFELLDLYRGLPGQPEVYLLTPPAAFFLKGKKEAIFKVNPTIIENEIVPILRRAAEQTDVPLVDVFSVTQGHPEYFKEGVHPNTLGSKVIAETVYAALKKYGF
jgi:acyl-CoA thioesterase I